MKVKRRMKPIISVLLTVCILMSICVPVVYDRYLKLPAEAVEEGPQAAQAHQVEQRRLPVM